MKYRANPTIIKRLIERNKCFMCKHRFDKPLLMPVDKPKKGKLQPNFNVEFVFHVYETHGIPPDIFKNWVIGIVYGMELNEFGIKGVHISEEFY